MDDYRLDYRPMLAVDIASSAGRGNVALMKIRDELFTTLRESFQRSGICWEACHHDDLGDGLRIMPPSGSPKAELIYPVLSELAIRLRTHNRTAGPTTRIRVRAALHAGELCLGPADEITGQPLEVLARMLDAQPVRTALAEAPDAATVAVLLSQHFYDETVRHGYPGIDPDDFRQVSFTAKEYTAQAWLYVPGFPSVLSTSVTSVPKAPQKAGAVSHDVGPHADRAVMVNRAEGHGTIYALQDGLQNVHVTGKP
jgi:hypothetical protein